MKSGTLNALVGAILRRMKDKDYLLIPIFTCLFAIGGATFGMHEEAWGFIPLFVAIALSLGYDRVVGAGIVELGTVTGCAGAIFNPFNVGIASGIAGVPLTTPVLTVFRCVTLVIFTACTTLPAAYGRRLRGAERHARTCRSRRCGDLQGLGRRRNQAWSDATTSLNILIAYRKRRQKRGVEDENCSDHRGILRYGAGVCPPDSAFQYEPG